MGMPDFLKILIALMASAVVGLILMILINFFRSKDNKLTEKWPSVLAFVGFGFIITATIRSLFKEVYATIDLWHFLLVLGLVLSLIGLIPIFRQIVKKNENDRIHDYISKIKKQ